MQITKHKTYTSLIIWIATLLLIGSSIGSINKSSIDSWYVTLNQSSLTPPNYFFGIAWSILYSMIAISGWLIWRSETFSRLKIIKILYAIQLILNWSWTPLFFTYHLTGISLLCIILIIVLITSLIIVSYQKLFTSSLLLIPYLLWSVFAAYLNLYIWLYN